MDTSAILFEDFLLLSEKEKYDIAENIWAENELDLVENGLVWCNEFDCYMIPLYCTEKLPQTVTYKDIVRTIKCPSCQEGVHILADSLDSLISDIQYVSFTPIDEIRVLGICTTDYCFEIIDITDQLKYLI